jgi:hypothetical protein
MHVDLGIVDMELGFFYDNFKFDDLVLSTL